MFLTLFYFQFHSSETQMYISNLYTRSTAIQFTTEKIIVKSWALFLFSAEVKRHADMKLTLVFLMANLTILLLYKSTFREVPRDVFCGVGVVEWCGYFARTIPTSAVPNKYETTCES